MFFKKDFYEILSNIKAYQSETVSQHSPCLNSPSCCMPSCLFTKGLLFILTSICYVCLYSHNNLPGFTDWMVWRVWIKKKAVSWVWLVLSAH